MFTPKTPHFFKIILEDTIQDWKLRIPTKFVRKYGSCLSISSVILIVPSGATWHVGLTKSDDNGVWLQHEWQIIHVLNHIEDDKNDEECQEHNKEAAKAGTSAAIFLSQERKGKEQNPMHQLLALSPKTKKLVDQKFPGLRELQNIPVEFINAYFNKEHNNVILQLQDGKAWPMKYYVSKHMKRLAKLISGWPAFVLDNHLEDIVQALGVNTVIQE
ncbi:hypothetical protein REPUB_Repub09cG0169800 [Reevesia pubescens]